MSTRREATNVRLRNLPDIGNKLACALFYALELKIPVFPLHETDGEGCSCGKPDCSPKDWGKHPRWLKGDLEHGLKDATREEEKIMGWWRIWPDANIGGAMGRSSGMTVADADTPEVVAFLEKHAPDAPSQITGSGMKQFFFSYEEALGLKNWQKIMGGMDIKTEGGYVVLPPSRNAEGLYRWNSIPYEVPPMPPEVSKVILNHQEKEKKAVSSTSLKIGKTLEGVSLDSVNEVLEGIRKSFSREENIPVGSRHTRLLEIGGLLRRRAVGEDRIRIVLLWLNENLCEEPLIPYEMNGIISSVMNIQREVNTIADEFEIWLEHQGDNIIFKGVSGATNRKVVTTLLKEARKYGTKGVKGLDVSIGRLNIVALSGVSYTTVHKVIKRLDLLSSTPPDPYSYKNAWTVTVHYPQGYEVNEDGEVVVIPFEGENVRKVNNLDTPSTLIEEDVYLSYIPFVHLEVRSRWGGGLMGLTKEWFLNSILSNIPLGEPFNIRDLDFIYKDYNFKRRHLCDFVDERKLGRYGLVERIRKGVYVIPEDFPEKYEAYRINSGEDLVEEKVRREIAKWRAAWRYGLDLQKAVRKGESLDEVPVPDEIGEARALKILEKARVSEEESRKDNEFFESYSSG